MLALLEHNIALNSPLAANFRELHWESASDADFMVAPATQDGIVHSVDVVIGTDLVEVDPDRSSGADIFAALRHVLLMSLSSLRGGFFIIVFEERGCGSLQCL